MATVKDVKIEKLSKEELEQKGVFVWPIWQKEESIFDWYYDETEQCYIIEGEVIVSDKQGNTIKVQEGDFVTFPKGLACTWDIRKKIVKHYNFL